jgi:hypothetical protein
MSCIEWPKPPNRISLRRRVLLQLASAGELKRHTSCVLRYRFDDEYGDASIVLSLETPVRIADGTENETDLLQGATFADFENVRHT